MESIILKIAATHMRPLLMGLSVLVFYRGHNEPGGGFIGGLMLGSAFILYAMAHGVEAAQKKLRFNPMNITATGLMIALLSGFAGVFANLEYMTGQWITLFGGTAFELKLGTPLLFDLGVYFSVAGMLMLVLFSILEE